MIRSFNKKFAAKGLGLLAMVFGATLAFAGTVKEYNAEIVDVKSGRVEGKVFATPTKMRNEFYDQGGKLQGISIFRLDQKKMFILWVERKSYFEIPIKSKTVLELEKEAKIINGLMTDGAIPTMEKEKVGEETVNGYKTEKFRVTTHKDHMGRKETSVLYQWMAKEFDIPVRVLNSDNEKDDTFKELRNIKRGTPDASLFKLPAGYTLDKEGMKPITERMQSKKK